MILNVFCLSACLSNRILPGFFEDFARILPDFARMLPGFSQDSAGFCQDFARIFPGFCKNSARIFPACLPVRLSGFCQDFPGFSSNSPRFCQDVTRISPGLCRILPGFCRNSARIFSEFSQDIARIVPRFCQDVARNLIGFWQHSRCLPACLLASCLLAWLRACGCLPASPCVSSWLPVFEAGCLHGCLPACASSSLRIFIARENNSI